MLRRRRFTLTSISLLLAANGIYAETINLGGGSVTLDASPSSPGITFKNVLLNGAGVQNGTSLNGHFQGEDAGTPTVKLIGNESMTGSGGQAKFGADDGLLNYFRVELIPNTNAYDAIQVNLGYANPDGGHHETGGVVVSGMTTAGAFSFASLDIGSNGQNFLLGTSTGTTFLYVDFTVTAGDLTPNGLSEVTQVRIRQAPGSPVPLPAAAPAGLALLSTLAFHRRRRSSEI